MASFDRLIDSRWAYAVLAGLVFLLALPGLFALPTLDRDEGRFAEASSEMMESGDYVVIRYHDDLRNKKPVAIHWFQSALVSLTSGPAERNIADYRLASMLGAMGNVKLSHLLDLNLGALHAKGVDEAVERLG